MFRREADTQEIAAMQNTRGLTGEETRRRIRPADRDTRSADKKAPARDFH